METILAFYMVTGLWVYFWAIAFFCTILWFGENEMNWFAGVALIAFATLMQNSGIITILTDPWALLKWGLVYYIIGGAWSFFKWRMFAGDRASYFADRKLTFINFYNEHVRKYNATTDHSDRGNVDKDVNGNPIKLPYREEGYQTLEASALTKFDDFMKAAFNRYVGHTQRYNDDNTDLSHFKPVATENKSKVVSWILWWPTSMFWTVLHDFFIRLGEWFVETFQGVYSRLTNQAFSKYDI